MCTMITDLTTWGAWVGCNPSVDETHLFSSQSHLSNFVSARKVEKSSFPVTT